MVDTYYGPTVLHVGERDPKDSKYATDEYVYADPGVGGKVIVAPRLKDEKPSLKNAIKALNQKAPGLVGMQGGGGIFQGGNLIAQLMQMLTGGQAQNFATELPMTQLAIMQALGLIDPHLFGITDPAEFRTRLSWGLGTPTLGAQQQKWQQGMSEKQFAEGTRQFDVSSGLQQAEQAYQRSIRGLKGLPAMGNVGGMPSMGTGTSL
jgi:hypothetical protein